MPTYTYEIEGSGERVEVTLMMSEITPLNELVPFQVEGVECMARRVPDTPNGRKREYVVVSRNLKRWDPDAPHHAKDGRCAFESKREIDDFISKKADKPGSHYAFD